MSEAGNMNFSVSVPGKGSSGKISRILTLDRLIEWIRAQDFDEHTTQSLIKLASRYPSHALPMFKKNFNLMLQRARAMRQKDAAGFEEPQVEEQTQESFSNLDAGINQSWKESENVSTEETPQEEEQAQQTVDNKEEDNFKKEERSQDSLADQTDSNPQ